MDPFVIVVLAGLAVAFAWLWMVGNANQRGTAQASLGLRCARQIIEQREALDAQDLAQMLEASNARRRQRGLPERDGDDVLSDLGSAPDR